MSNKGPIEICGVDPILYERRTAKFAKAMVTQMSEGMVSPEELVIAAMAAQKVTVTMAKMMNELGDKPERDPRGLVILLSTLETHWRALLEQEFNAEIDHHGRVTIREK